MSREEVLSLSLFCIIYCQHDHWRWAERVRSTFGLEATSEGATLGVNNSAARILSRQKIIWDPYSVISDISLILHFLSKDYLEAIIRKCYLRAIFCNVLASGGQVGTATTVSIGLTLAGRGNLEICKHLMVRSDLRSRNLFLVSVMFSENNTKIYVFPE